MSTMLQLVSTPVTVAIPRTSPSGSCSAHCHAATLPPPAPAMPGGDTHRLPSPALTAPAAPFDVGRTKGVFGWATLVGNTSIPYLMRGDDKYVSVRMVEKTILSHYPRIYPPDLRDRPPLVSQYASETDANILNEINQQHCEYAYGPEMFAAGKDLLVKLDDFEEFHRLVRRNFPRQARTGSDTQRQECVTSWLQVNNTLVPLVLRASGERLAPSSVLRHAAGLIPRNFVPITTGERRALDASCRRAGLAFEFPVSTRLVDIDTVRQMYPQVMMTQLATHDPFYYAQYHQGQPSAPVTTQNGNEKTTPILTQGSAWMDLPSNMLGMPVVSTGTQLPSASASAQPSPPTQALLRNSNLRGLQTVVSDVSTGYRWAYGFSAYSNAATFAAHTPTAAPVVVPLTATTVCQPPFLSPNMLPGVRPLSVLGRLIACVFRSATSESCYVPIGALASAFFGADYEGALVETLGRVLGVPLHDITPAEEAAYMQVVGAPLTCRKIVALPTFERLFSQLQYMLSSSPAAVKRPAPGTAGSSPPTAKAIKQETVTSLEVDLVSRMTRRRDTGPLICID